jgi:predicted acetyltransferase
MGSLKDQYHFATVQLPEDLPLNVILGEKQMTHRVSRNHPNAEARPFTRMQVRVLDHKKFLEAMKLRPESRGKCVVSVREPEGESNKFAIEIGDGRISVAASGATADIECEAHHWAMIATGELEATLAAELGLIDGKSRASLEVLDLLAQGVKPYCREYF